MIVLKFEDNEIHFESGYSLFRALRLMSEIIGHRGFHPKGRSNGQGFHKNGESYRLIAPLIGAGILKTEPHPASTKHEYVFLTPMGFRFLSLPDNFLTEKEKEQ